MLKYLPQLIKIAKLIPYLVVAIIAGIISGTMVKCSSKQETIPVKIELYNYEKSLNEIRAKRDSTVNSIPTLYDASRYLHDRYNREASANNTK